VLIGGPQATGAPNQRAPRLAPNSSFSATNAEDGALNVPVLTGPDRKSMSTRPTPPPPNSNYQEPRP
jgi:hypothetical protein